MGNAQEFVTEIGNTAANPGELISVETNETFRLEHKAFYPFLLALICEGLSH